MSHSATVIVLTYNPNKEKLLQTLRSILWQKDIDMEIIVADDGSKENYFEEAKALFDQYGFSDYQLSGNAKNQGTVKNIWQASQKATGKYIKLISPGDLFYSDNILHDWVEFMEKKKCEVSICNVVNYKWGQDEISLVRDLRMPKSYEPYKEDKNGNFNMNKLRMHALLYRDQLHGASILTTKNYLLTYLKEVKAVSIYVEDLMVRLSIFDGIPIYHFDHLGIWYETGSGVSLNPEWRLKLRRDVQGIMSLMFAREPIDDFTRKYHRYMNSRGIFHHLLTVLYFPSKLYGKPKRAWSPVDNINKDFFYQCWKGE